MSFVNRFLNWNSAIYIVLGAHFIVWFGFALMLDVHPDMADHWVWSRFLAGGYYEHPPGVALTIRAATLLGGSSVLTLKLGSIIFSVLMMLSCFLVGKQFFNQRSALIFVLILETVPAFSMGSIFWSIDHPLLLFWLLALLFVGKYIKSKNLNWFFPFGVVAGLGALSKYTMILLPISLVIWCLRHKEHRRLLYHWKVYAGALLAFLLLSPHLYWNYQNQYQALGFAVGKGLTGGYSLQSLLEFIGAQFFVFSIVYTVYFWLTFGRRLFSGRVAFVKCGDSTSFLWITGVMPTVFFTISSYFGKYTDPSWLNISYLSLFLLLAQHIDLEIFHGKAVRESLTYLLASVVNLTIAVLVILHLNLNIFAITNDDGIFKMIGWRDTSKQISQLFAKQQISVPEYVISREYQTASALALYMDHQPFPHSIEKLGRNQWSPVVKILEQGAVLVCPPEKCKETLRAAEARFQRPFKFMGATALSGHKAGIRELRVYYLPGGK
jgi:4-amino-4-deoxy-L-arabinose transferase-like glycosyltransferase